MRKNIPWILGCAIWLMNSALMAQQGVNPNRPIHRKASKLDSKRSLADKVISSNDSSSKNKNPATMASDSVVNANSEQNPPKNQKLKESKLVKSKLIPSSEMSFYQPVFGGPAGPNKFHIYISGRSTMGSDILISRKAGFVFFNQGTIRRKKIAKMMTGPRRVKVKKNKEFQFHLKLPQGRVQVAIKRRDPISKTFRTYTLVLMVKKHAVTIVNSPALKRLDLQDQSLKIALGAGVNFTSYAQKSPDLSTNLNLNSFTSPALSALIWYPFTDQLSFQFMFNSLPGKIASSEDDLGLNDKLDFNWLIYTLEAAYTPMSWKKPKFPSEGGSAHLLLALQHHQLPFLERGVSGAHGIAINAVSMLAIGAKYEYKLSKQWQLETFLRYQLPIATGELFVISKALAFDGSLGTKYRTAKSQHIGIFWYGQYHDYSFAHKSPCVASGVCLGANPITGEQQILVSNIELRYYFEY